MKDCWVEQAPPGHGEHKAAEASAAALAVEELKLKGHVVTPMCLFGVGALSLQPQSLDLLQATRFET